MGFTFDPPFLKCSGKLYQNANVRTVLKYTERNLEYWLQY
jgi:hypothetical protein